jgi:Taurine catabolism dioxygenase TauD, TfdA family
MIKTRQLPVATLSAGEADRSALLDGTVVPEAFRRFAAEAIDHMGRSPFACVLRDTGFLEVPADRRDAYVRALTALFGTISDSNRFDDQSGTFVDAVAPTEPTSTDPTFTLGACEAHADESSKPNPEDVVLLWCVHQAEDGGESLLWPTDDLRATIAAGEDGDTHLRMLLEPDFLFGGKLRNPPRVLRAPVFFGTDGVRFRLGSLQDAREVVGSPFPPAQREALTRLVDAVAETDPYRYRLADGEVLVMMNRRALHARGDFTDRSRLLLRTRCFNQELSNSGLDNAEWMS